MLFLNGTVVNEQDYDIVGQTITNFPSIVTGDLEIIQWTANNLGTPNGNPVNAVIYTIIGQSNYPFSYDANAFNLYENGVLLVDSSDYTKVTGQYTLTTIPDNSISVLQQQSFARTGSA